MMKRISTEKRFGWLLWPVLVIISGALALLVMNVGVGLLAQLGIPLDGESTLMQLLLSVMIYGLILFFLYWLAGLLRRSITRVDAGIRYLTWTDIGLALVAFVGYFLLSTLIAVTVKALVPDFPSEQCQDVGFKQAFGVERMMAFLALVVMAPVVEELVFRGVLYGKMRRAGLHIVPSIFITSLLFAVVHWQWNVGLDVFALSVVACLLRERTQGIGASILLHMMKNGIAFYLLFVAMTPCVGG